MNPVSLLRDAIELLNFRHFSKLTFRLTVLCAAVLLLLSEMPSVYSSFGQIFSYVELRHSISATDSHGSKSIVVTIQNVGTAKATDVTIMVRSPRGRMARYEMISDEIFDTAKVSEKNQILLLQYKRMAAQAKIQIVFQDAALSTNDVTVSATSDQGRSLGVEVETVASEVPKLRDRFRHEFGNGWRSLLSKFPSSAIFFDTEIALKDHKAIQRVLWEFGSSDYRSMCLFVLTICALLELFVPGYFFSFFAMLFSFANGVWFYGVPIPLGFAILVGGMPPLLLLLCTPYRLGMEKFLKGFERPNTWSIDSLEHTASLLGVGVRVLLVYAYYWLVTRTWHTEFPSPIALAFIPVSEMPLIWFQTSVLVAAIFVCIFMYPGSLRQAGQFIAANDGVKRRDVLSEPPRVVAAPSIDDRVALLERLLTTSHVQGIKISSRQVLRTRKR